MKILILICSLVVTLLMGGNAFAKDDRYYLSGCEDGILYVPVVNVWSKAGGITNGARVVGQLSGGNDGTCVGDIVYLDFFSGQFARIKTSWGLVGWVPKSMLGGKL